VTEDPTANASHRPWPLPSSKWVMAQRWSSLLFMHWEVRADALEALIPKPLALDRYGRTAWISIAPFYLSHLRARGLPPFPGISAFAELNVRTYVTPT
jgi:uncharacterized protein